MNSVLKGVASPSAFSAPCGMVFHVLNRGVGRQNLFDKSGDFLAFERVICEAKRILPMRICSFCLMSNYWHFILWPENDGDLSAFMQQLTNTHVKRWKEHRHQSGYGHLYQGRYKSFPIQTDEYFYPAARYVQRNALRANLVDRAEQWPWSSLGGPTRQNFPREILSDWPLQRPHNWTELVNNPQTEAEAAALRQCVNRGSPYFQKQWVDQTAKRLSL